MIRFMFSLVLNGVSFNNSGSFSKISDRFRNVQISPNPEGDLELIVEKENARWIVLLEKEAMIEANDLVDRLSLLNEHRIRSLTYKGFYDISGNFIPYQEKIRKKFTLTRIIKNPEEFYSQGYNKSILNSKKYSGILRIFRTAQGISDKISQYLIFYGLLLILNGEKQREVDKYIKKEIPDILIVSGRSGDETIITNIRNMIAHPPKDLDMDDLNNKVSDYIRELEDLVLRILRES